MMATGWADFPYTPNWPGQADYRGEILHSSRYRNPAPYAGKRVLVVGFGNSGGEIALDLAEADVAVTLAVRGPVKILPRDLLGLPILSWAICRPGCRPAWPTSSTHPCSASPSAPPATWGCRWCARGRCA